MFHICLIIVGVISLIVWSLVPSSSWTKKGSLLVKTIEVLSITSFLFAIFLFFFSPLKWEFGYEREGEEIISFTDQGFTVHRHGTWDSVAYSWRKDEWTLRVQGEDGISVTVEVYYRLNPVWFHSKYPGTREIEISNVSQGDKDVIYNGLIQVINPNELLKDRYDSGNEAMVKILTAKMNLVPNIYDVIVRYVVFKEVREWQEVKPRRTEKIL